MRLVPVADAVGRVLVHDVTEVTRDPDRKHCAFPRGHVVREEDVARLLDLGKRHVYVVTPEPGKVHENDAASWLAEAVAGEGVELTRAREGRVDLRAQRDGMVVVDLEGLNELNRLGDVICATRRSYSRVQTGGTAAAVRVMPLFIDRGVIELAEDLARARGGLVEVRAPKRFRAGLVVTGSELVSGRVRDAFELVVRRKLEEVGSEVAGKLVSDDEPAEIERAIRGHLCAGCDMVIVTGGMSVDPDDRTPAAIRRVASRIAFQGAPVMPGCMTMVGLAQSPVTGEEVPIVGVPACAIHHERTVLDLVLTRLLAGDIPSADDVRRLGHGGLCLGCDDCRFPDCAFGSL